MSEPETGTHHRVVVIGGGYAGTLAANRLLGRDDVAVTLVNPRATFVDRIRLHQLVARTGAATTDLAGLLAPEVDLVVDGARRIDTVDRTVHLASGRTLDYDYVVYAVGSTGAVPSTVPGAVEHAASVAELEPALRLRDRLAALDPAAPVVVVGGGLTGIETAAELVERGRRVTLVSGSPLAPSLSAAGRRYIDRWLRHNGARVVTGRVAEVHPDAVVLADGSTLPSALTVWTAGFGVPGLATASGLRTDELGRLLTDETLTSVDDARVVAAGDAAAPSGHPLRMSCQAAGPLGALAADTVLSRLAGTAPPTLDLAFVGSCVSLGRKSGIRQFGRKDDTPLDLWFGGRAGAAYKELTCRWGIAKLGREARRPGSLTWLRGGRRSLAGAPKVAAS
ncbi:NAD(P)/FAD-dependent oxidoreductase [Promicromonospora sp. NPDC019610]|uniref:NAD(P)/FAD-dependent oxidoreductase n=1 Tax=Promicromonospora sp. NPDC019610 TaxID=3364405 RepID=UPI003792594D